MHTLRAIAGTLIGYLISAISSIAWFFTITHRDPTIPASPVYIGISTLFGVVFSVIGGFIGAAIAHGSERNVGPAIAFVTALVAAWSWWESPGYAHWAQAVAVAFMAPAAIFGSRLFAHRRQA
jgi:hypothetical protein